MSLMRKRRLERLERRQPCGKPWVDALRALLEARPFSSMPMPDHELTEEQETARRRITQQLDQIAERLGGETEAERERRLAANLRAIEKEQEARQAA